MDAPQGGRLHLETADGATRRIKTGLLAYGSRLKPLAEEYIRRAHVAPGPERD